MVVLSKKNTAVCFSIIALLCIALLSFSYLHKKNWLNTPFFRSPAVNRPLLCQGAYDFMIAASDGSQSFITEGVLTPCDPPPHTSQLLQITVLPDANNLRAYVITDTRTALVQFIKNPEKPNEWFASWTADDTYAHTYTVIIKGRVGDSEKEIPITFR